MTHTWPAPPIKSNYLANDENLVRPNHWLFPSEPINNHRIEALREKFVPYNIIDLTLLACVLSSLGVIGVSITYTLPRFVSFSSSHIGRLVQWYPKPKSSGAEDDIQNSFHPRKVRVALTPSSFDSAMQGLGCFMSYGYWDPEAEGSKAWQMV